MTDTPRPDETEREAADELARLGQEMGLDAGSPVTFTGDGVMQMVAEFNDRCEALSTGLRSMARRSVHQRRWAGRATAKSHKNLRAYEDLLRKLGSAVGVHVGHPGEQRYPEFVERICAAALDLRAKNATQRAELAELKAGRVVVAGEEGPSLFEVDSALLELLREAMGMWGPRVVAQTAAQLAAPGPRPGPAPSAPTTHPPSEACVHCATPARLASVDPVVDCAREECPHVGSGVRCGHDRRHGFDDGACVELAEDEDMGPSTEQGREHRG